MNRLINSQCKNNEKKTEYSFPKILLSFLKLTYIRTKAKLCEEYVNKSQK